MTTQNKIYIALKDIESGLKDDKVSYVKNNKDNNNIYRITKGKDKNIVIDLVIRHWEGLYDDITNFPLETTFQHVKHELLEVHVANMILTVTRSYK